MTTRSLLLALLLCGCGSDREPAATFTTSIDTVGGIVRVTSAGPPETRIARRLYTVGTADGEVRFGRIMSVAADGSGRAYVADGMESRVWVFDSTGASVAAFGREGEGPGEFRDLYSVALLGDTVVTLDARAARLGLFDGSGAWLGQWRHQPLSGGVRLEGVTDDEIYNPIVIPRERTLDRAYVRLTRAGPADTVVMPGRDPRAASSGVTCLGADGGIHFKANPFAGRELIRAAPGGTLLQAWTADYRIAVLDGALDTVRVIERAGPRAPLSDEAWQAHVEEFRDWFDGIPSPQCEGRSEPVRPPSYPAIREIVLDPTGRIWVEAYTEAGFAFDVFGLDGTLLATVPAPDRDEAVRPFARGDRLYVVTADSLGVQRLEAYATAGR